MYLDVHIGRMDDDEFVANRDTPSGAVPKALSPLFPDGHRAFWEVKRRLHDGRLTGGATDWAGWVAPASKEVIAAVFRDLYTDRPDYGPDTSYPHLRQQMEALGAFIDAIDDDGQWALVATEL